jgi:cytochrome bd-type quinol oxidase subunit 1
VALDVLELSRIQFALTVMFHYLFPPLSMGLGTLMVLMEGTYLRTGDARSHAMTKFWTKIVAPQRGCWRRMTSRPMSGSFASFWKLL